MMIMGKMHYRGLEMAWLHLCSKFQTRLDEEGIRRFLIRAVLCIGVTNIALDDHKV